METTKAQFNFRSMRQFKQVRMWPRQGSNPDLSEIPYLITELMKTFCSGTSWPLNLIKLNRVRMDGQLFPILRVDIFFLPFFPSHGQKSQRFPPGKNARKEEQINAQNLLLLLYLLHSLLFLRFHFSARERKKNRKKFFTQVFSFFLRSSSSCLLARWLERLLLLTAVRKTVTMM